MANTIAPKNLAQESDATKFPTALVIIWNDRGELKKANISQVVSANILKDATPIQGSTRLITSGGVWNFTYSKANVDALIATINANKADKSETYTIIQVNALLNDKANVADVYTKTQVDVYVNYYVNYVVTLLESKENIADKESFADNTFITLANNTIYTASEPISVLSLRAQASGTSVVSFDTASSGSITITTSGITFPSQPEFGNNEHWEIAIRNGYAVYTKYDLV